MNTGGAPGNPCSAPNCSASGDFGTDPVRGVTWPQGSWTAWDNPPASGPNNAGGAWTSRNTGQLQEGILIEGMMEYALNRGSSWAAYEDTMDLAFANGMFVRNELTVTGDPVRLNNGTRAGIALIIATTSSSVQCGNTQHMAGLFWSERFLLHHGDFARVLGGHGLDPILQRQPLSGLLLNGRRKHV